MLMKEKLVLNIQIWDTSKNKIYSEEDVIDKKFWNKVTCNYKGNHVSVVVNIKGVVTCKKFLLEKINIALRRLDSALH